MEILIIIGLILLNGIFSMSEISLVSARKFKLENAAKKGNVNAKKALDLANSPNTFLSTVQIGITLIGILTGIFSGEKITSDINAAISSVSFLQPYAESLSVLVVVIIVTYFSIVFGELIPKRVGLLFPERISMVMARPMHLVSKVAAPFIWLLTRTNDMVLRLFGIKENMDNKVTEEEIKAMIQDSTDQGDIQKIEQDIVHRVFALGDRRVGELMTHRSEVAWLDIEDSLGAIKQKSADSLHTIYPVSKGSLDNLQGIVSLKEFFPRNFNSESFDLTSFIRKPLIVHDNTPAFQALEKFREAKTHFAVVVDEYGTIQGVVSMDDILDALVGDVSERDQDEYQIVQRAENSWLADGQIPFYEVLHYFGLTDIEQEETNGDFNTIAGLILTKCGRVPSTGDKIVWRDFEIEVVDMDGLKIDKVLITRNPE